MRDADCIFCAILRGELPASIVHEDEQVVAFLDINPVNPGHALVIPRAHAVGLADLLTDTGRAMFETGQRIAAAIRSSDLPCDGMNLFLFDGAAAGQTVFHVHLHVIPRLAGDGYTLDTGDGFTLHVDYGPPPARADLDGIAQRLRRAMPGRSSQAA